MRVAVPSEAEETVYLGPPLDQGSFRLADVGGLPVLETPCLWPQDLTETHGINITAQLLRGMVADYNLAVEEATLNRDHAWDGPTLGGAKRLWMGEAEQLWARYEDLDAVLVQEIREKRWTRRSAEFVLRHAATGRPYFTGLAVLGQQRPGLTKQPPLVVSLKRPIAHAQLGAPAPQEDAMADTPVKKADTPDAPVAPAAAPVVPANHDSASLALATAQRVEALVAAADARLAAAETKLTEAEKKLATSQRKSAELDVRTKLDALGGRLTPAMRKAVEPLLVELLASPTAIVVKLSATGGAASSAPVDVPVADRLFELLAACPDQRVIGRPPQADADPTAAADPELAKLAGVKPERLAELEQRFALSEGWGFNPESSN